MNVLVIPSVRENCLNDFLQKWENNGDWDEIVLIEDNPEKTFKIKSKWKIHHYSHKEIKENLKENDWIISKKDSACRSFGFKIAKEIGANWTISLDDDCLPYQSMGICENHLKVINNFKICQQSTIIRSRGLPYKNMGNLNNIVLNMGLWTKNADLDAIQTFHNNIEYFLPPNGNFLAHPRHRYPFCGMNIFFNTSLTPIMYFPLMGLNQPYNRFDDIWCGWIFQKILQHLNLSWSIGEPFIEHSKASDPFINLIKEAPGVQKNEIFWQIIDNIPLTAKTPVDCIKQIGNHLKNENK